MSMNVPGKREEKETYRIVVFPAASRPTIKIRISTREKSAKTLRLKAAIGPVPFFPNKPDNSFETEANQHR